MAGEQGFATGRGYQDERMKRAAREEAAKSIMQGGDTKSALARLLSVGDLQGASTIANLNNQDFDRQFRTQEAQRSQSNADRSFGLQEQLVNRREVPEAVRTLQAAGIDPRSPQGQKALFPRTDTPISTTDKKAIFEAEDLVPQLQGTIENLSRAVDLNGRTFTGYGAGLRADIGTKLPGGSLFIDEKKARDTSEWQKIMGPEALQQMANTLKGATTDFELRKFIEMLGDPATDPQVRKGVIERMKKLAERKLEIQQSRVKDLRGGTYFKPEAGQPASPVATSSQQTWKDPATGKEYIVRDGKLFAQ